jgi:CDP-4-dehydro-6-deoxyglucose reductase
MSDHQLITLSRAARLIGVIRGELQKKIQQGDLHAFDGMISIDDLLLAYPRAQLEDDVEYRRVSQIKEKAFGKRIYERAMPDVDTLAARVTELSKELAISQGQVRQFRHLLDRLHDKLKEVGAASGRRCAGRPQGIDRLAGRRSDGDAGTGLPQSAGGARQPAARHGGACHGAAERARFLHRRPGHAARRRVCAPVSRSITGAAAATAGLCKAKIVAGQVKKTRHHDYVLSESEKAQGYVLLCSNTAVTDVEVEAPVAGGVQDIPYQEVAAKVKSVDLLNQNMALLHLQTPRSTRLRFLAGQSVTLRVGDAFTAGLPVASCPCDDRNILFHVRRMPGNLFADYVFDRLKPGEVVAIEGPEGEFVLQEKITRPLYFFAFDTGFAPVKSLIEHAMSLEPEETINLYWIGSGENSIYLPNVPRAWADALDNFRYTRLVAGHDLSNLTQLREAALRTMLEEIINAHPEVADGDLYIAGPEAASRVAENFFLGLGLPKTRVFLAFS